VHRTLRRLAADRPGAELIVVTHGGPVRVASVASLPPPGTPLHRPPVGNASITLWPGLTQTELRV
jgi:2,3-bisphosphoglycerate-dependent phosphoglycerate mutase